MIGRSQLVRRERAASGLESRGTLVALHSDGADSSELLPLCAELGAGFDVLAPQGRAVLVGLTGAKVTLDPYREILGPEAELIGSNDHTLPELLELIAFVERGRCRGACPRRRPCPARHHPRGHRAVGTPRSAEPAERHPRTPRRSLRRRGDIDGGA